jgi:hypothetical protein
MKATTSTHHRHHPTITSLPTANAPPLALALALARQLLGLQPRLPDSRPQPLSPAPLLPLRIADPPDRALPVAAEAKVFVARSLQLRLGGRRPAGLWAGLARLAFRLRGRRGWWRRRLLASGAENGGGGAAGVFWDLGVWAVGA